ncbi:MAG: DUF616 domain-containing protein [Elusimicrobiaceae bacterium]|nr:DUF616 domain-containing protein [Elusimicrobiaceae bacterium]
MRLKNLTKNLYSKIKKQLGLDFCDRSLANLEKDQIARSIFWDAQWYVQTYNHPFDRADALNYWYSKGWQKGEAPSRYFDKNYINFARTQGINPILLYEGHGPRFFPSRHNAFKSAIEDTQTIQNYLAYKPTRKAKGVVYTCITNDYDDIREIETYTYVDRDWDYVCFTDNPKDIASGQIGIWQIRPLQFAKLDNIRNQRWHKTHPHALFPNYESSCWIDGNINILSNYLFKTIDQKNTDFLVPAHFKNTCIYQEYQDVLLAKLDNPKLIEQERDFIMQAGMPIQYGTPETNILFRKHHQDTIQQLDETWWNMIEKYSTRDQLAAAFLMWKYELKPTDIFLLNTRVAVYDFYVFKHTSKGD